jgi:hypothetical protein
MRQGLGFEHPLCDRIQLLMLILFFGVWAIDSLSFLIFGCSTVIFQALTFPPLLAGTILLARAVEFDNYQFCMFRNE